MPELTKIQKYRQLLAKSLRAEGAVHLFEDVFLLPEELTTKAEYEARAKMARMELLEFIMSVDDITTL